MQVITTLTDGRTMREVFDPRKYDANADTRQSSNIERKTRFLSCDCMLVERDARLYPCIECGDNMLVHVVTGVSHFIPRDSDSEEGELETLLFEDDE
jgi:hypothetical protein